MPARIRKTAVPARDSPKSQATRARIMQTAAAFISERGSTDFQMNEISERCNLSKGSLYYYFIDKAGLLDAVFAQAIGDLVVQVEEAVETASAPLEALVRIVGALVGCIRAERPLVFAMIEELLRSPDAEAAPAPMRFAHVLDLLEHHLDQAKGEGLISSGLDSRLAANAIAGACIYHALAPSARGASADDTVCAYLLLVMNGAATEKGREAIRSCEGPGA